MDLDSNYYSSRCKEINGLWVVKGTFMTFVGGFVIIKRLKESFASVGLEMLQGRASLKTSKARGIPWGENGYYQFYQFG